MSTQNNSVLFLQQREDGIDRPAANFGYPHFLKRIINLKLND